MPFERSLAVPIERLFQVLRRPLLLRSGVAKLEGLAQTTKMRANEMVRVTGLTKPRREPLEFGRKMRVFVEPVHLRQQFAKHNAPNEY
jgi:hypothetical protein